jgi:hypothetical protein
MLLELLVSRRALKSVQLAKQGFGQPRGCTFINVSQFLPKLKYYENSEKIDVLFYYYIKILI